MTCSVVPSVLGLGSYFEFPQIFHGQSSGPGGRRPGRWEVGVQWEPSDQLLPSLSLHSSPRKWG